MMKGKGKKGKELEEKASSPVNEFKKLDLSRECPKYLEILDRNIEEGIKLEELDALQLEIESLLVSIVYRKRQLQDDVEKDKPNKQDALKRSKGDERLSSKKFKDDQEISDNSSNSSNSYSSSYSSGSSKSSLREKAKKLKATAFDEAKFTASYTSYTTQNEVQNDIPNQFWRFVSTYCSPVRSEYLKTLEDLVSLYESEPDILKAVKKNNLNSNGKWSNDKAGLELNGNSKKEDKKKGKKADKKKGLVGVSLSDEKSKKSKDGRPDGDKCDYGVLTQRLVSCLIEEDFCAENFEDIFEEFSSDSKNANDVKLFKTISLNNAAQFEKMLRKELEEHGLIDVDDVFLSNEGSENEEDEINQEIVKCQNELRSIMTQNQFQVKKLANLIRADLKRQLILERLGRVNDEILEVSKRLMIIRQKRKNSKEAKREKEYVQKYLKDRTTLLQQLNLERKR